MSPILITNQQIEGSNFRYKYQKYKVKYRAENANNTATESQKSYM